LIYLFPETAGTFVNLFSQHKGLTVGSEKRYTILIKSYIIHTLGRGEDWNGERVLPHRHREHIERRMEGWKVGRME